MMKRVLCLLVALVGCTRPNPDYCAADSDCADPARPFCDINGEYDESSHTAHTCSVEPANCPAERCGCEPAEARCEGDNLITCNSDGRSETTTACAMGCSDADQRCFTFEPSNGLATAMAAAAAEPDVVLPAGARIDAGTGEVTTSSGTPINVKTMLMPQGASSMLRVYIAKSFVINSTTVSGLPAVAFVASETIEVGGKVDAAAHGSIAGAGVNTSASCGGGTAQIQASYTPGAGGGGNGTSGGSGGGDHTPGAQGGASVDPFSPLTGGCLGGRVLDSMSNLLAVGGNGGGAVQLVAGTKVTLDAAGLVNVGGGGGGGGTASGGGGAGGTVVLEAPVVHIEGGTAGVAANGGGGGACGMSGSDGTLDNSPAPSGQGGGACATINCGGHGGAITSPAAPACVCTVNCGTGTRYGGGGGAIGKLRIATRAGTADIVGSPILSAAQTTAKLDPK